MAIMEERRQGFSAAREQRTLAPVLVLWLGAMAILWLVAANAPTQRVELLLDPAASGALPWYVGLVAKLGVLGWCVASVVAIAGGHVARLAGRKHAASFLTGGGTLASLLLVDDLFLLHSAVLAKQLSVPKVVVVAVYAGLLVWWVAANVAELARTRWRLLAAGGLGLFGSAAVDVLVSPAVDQTTALLVEDGCKFLGILTVAAYFVRTGVDVLRSVLGQVAFDDGWDDEIDGPRTAIVLDYF